jgi:hypothetical protein
MNNEIDQRESRLMDFIDAQNKEKMNATAYDSINNSPEIKLRKLNDECQKGKSICIDTILAKVYKDALPFDDPKKNCSDDEAISCIHDYISNRTNGKNSEYYVKEAIRKTNSSALKGLLTEAENITKTFYKEKAKDIGTINIKDLNFDANLDNDSISKITKKLELDEIAEIIQNNVQKAMQDEADKAKKEADYNQKIEDSLTADPNVTDDASLQSAMEKINVIKQPTVYQPSLFEAVMIKCAGNNVNESSNNGFITEAIHEYTLLNMSKALKLENFTVESVKKLANDYASR